MSLSHPRRPLPSPEAPPCLNYEVPVRTNLFQRGAVKGLDLVVQLFAEAQAPAGPTGLLEGVSQKLGNQRQWWQRHASPALLLAGFGKYYVTLNMGLFFLGPFLGLHSADGWPTQH